MDLPVDPLRPVANWSRNAGWVGGTQTGELHDHDDAGRLAVLRRLAEPEIQDAGKEPSAWPSRLHRRRGDRIERRECVGRGDLQVGARVDSMRRGTRGVLGRGSGLRPGGRWSGGVASGGGRGRGRGRAGGAAAVPQASSDGDGTREMSRNPRARGRGGSSKTPRGRRTDVLVGDRSLGIAVIANFPRSRIVGALVGRRGCGHCRLCGDHVDPSVGVVPAMDDRTIVLPARGPRRSPCRGRTVAPSVGGRPSHRAARTRRKCPCAKTSESPGSQRVRAMTRSARRRDVVGRLSARPRSRPDPPTGRSTSISSVVRPSSSP